MALIRSTKKKDSSGIALFMVMAAVSVLAILVTEFTYIAHVSEMIAFGGLDQAKAHYLAKSGLKISLLRLKAYQQVKKLLKNMGGGQNVAAAVPKGMIEKIWNFPFYYPLPTTIPGLSPTEKEAINKFQKDSNLEGKFSAIIESESSKYNLNSLLANYQPGPGPSPSATPGASPSGTPPQAAPQNPPDNSQANFDAQTARDSLANYLGTLLTQKNESDADFAALYKDFRLDDLVDTIIAWGDRTYERRSPVNRDKVTFKRGPYYSVSELHMLPTMEDDLYNLFGPNLTASTTPGINVNTMTEATLHALVPLMNKEELKQFFKFRDADEADNLFTSDQAFFDYLGKHVSAFSSNPQSFNDFKNGLAKRNIRIVTDETQFKITVRAEVNQAVRTIEAWVTMGEPSASSQPNNPPGTPPQQPIPGASAAPQDSGLKITFMKIL